MPLISHGCSDTGCVRSQNEDRILFDDALGIYVVCDGIGGRRRGDLAAEIAVNAIREYVESSVDPVEVTWPFGFGPLVSFGGNRILTAIKMANRQVWRRAEESLQLLGMGTTVTAVLVDGNLAAAANVGDSRIYWIRGDHMQQLSIDDTAQMGTRTVLTRAVGPEQNVEVHLKEVTLAQGDILLLCSDGLHGYLPEGRIMEIVAGSASLADRAGELITATRAVGAPDNVSAVLVEYSGA